MKYSNTHTRRKIVMKRNMKRKGFTLVELLIVIVVIGILSAMMMLSSTEAVSSARASNVVSNMRNIKTAALSYYTDNMDDVNAAETGDDAAGKVPTNDEFVKYLSNEKDASITNGKSAYSVVVGDSATDQWYVKYDFSDVGGTDQTRIGEKLAGRAKSVGLLKEAKEDSDEYGKDKTYGTVYYRVR